MSSIVSPARRRGAWNAVCYGVGGYVLATVLAALGGSPGSGSITGDTITATVAVIGPIGGLAGTTLATRRYWRRQLRSHDLALFWFAVTTVVVICGYVYLSVDQASTATGLITGVAGLQVMRIGLLERSASYAGSALPQDPTLGSLRAHPR